jgi:hypothetical protein
MLKNISIKKIKIEKKNSNIITAVMKSPTA